MRRLLSLFTTIGLLGWGASGFMEPGGARGLTAQEPSTPSLVLDPARLAEMQYHFMHITLVQEAVIRGDLEAVRSPARELSALPMPWRVPASASPHVNLIRDAGRRLVAASTQAEAADNAATMLGVCGDCHATVGVSPVPSPQARREVGGMVGHMLEHQRAMDELVQGLIIPSATLSRQQAFADRTTQSPRVVSCARRDQCNP